MLPLHSEYRRRDPEAERKYMEIRSDIRKNYKPDAPVSAASLLARVRADVTHVTQEEADKVLPFVKRALEGEVECVARMCPGRLHNRFVVVLNRAVMNEWNGWGKGGDLTYLDEMLLLRKEPWFEGFDWGISHKDMPSEGMPRDITWAFYFCLKAWK